MWDISLHEEAPTGNLVVPAQGQRVRHALRLPGAAESCRAGVLLITYGMAPRSVTLTRGG
jgi:hypothetical protein